jgi:hypothetical protein
LLIESDHATASGIGEGAHAAAASFAGNCQCHAVVRKAALPLTLMVNSIYNGSRFEDL